MGVLTAGAEEELRCEWVRRRSVTMHDRHKACIAGCLIAAAVLPGCGVPDDKRGRQKLLAAERAAVRAEVREARQRRTDDPGGAEAYERARRAPLDPAVDPAVALEAARARRAEMPRYSARLDSLLPTEELAAAGANMAGAAALPGWEPLGPGNIGGRTRVLLVDPEDHEVLYVAAVSGGVFKTEDGGASWRALSDTLANVTVNSLVMDPFDHRVLWAGTGEGYFREVERGTGLPLRGHGIFKTEDGGATWEWLAATRGEDFYWVNDLVASPRARGRLYAATRTGVWRSTDAGATWQRLLDPAVNGGCLDLALRTDRANDVLFAACGSFAQASVYRSLAAEGEGGWTQVLSDPGMGRTSLAIAPSRQDVIYALAASNLSGPLGGPDQGLHAMFRSSSGGGAGSWRAQVRATSSNRLNALLLTNPIAAMSRECGDPEPDEFVTMGWYVNIVAVDPVNPERVWVAGVDWFRSDDGGRSWGPASFWWTWEYPSYVHADQHGMTFHPGWNGTTNQTLWVVGDGGVFRTDNARATIGWGADSLCDPGTSRIRWYSLNHGLAVTQFYHGAPFPGAQSYLGGTQDNGTVIGSDAEGPERWRGLFGGDGGYVAVDPNDPRRIYLEYQRFGFHRSVDGGATFSSASTGVPAAGDNFLFITPFVMDPSDPHRLWAGGRRVWRTDNRADSWSAASAALADGGSVSAIAVAPTRPEHVLVGTNMGGIARCDAATSAGPTTAWDLVRPQSGFVTWVTFDPNDADVAFATYGGFGGHHVFTSGDGGATWQPIDGAGDGALPDIPVHCLLVDPRRPERLFIGTDLGVFVSVDRGASWVVENTGFAAVVTESLALAHTPEGRSLLFAFTHGRGAWRVELSAPNQALRPPRRHLPRS
jgi:hypothetical protein